MMKEIINAMIILDTNDFATVQPEQLYLGSAKAAQDRELLKKHKITHIVNVTSGIPCHFEDEFDYFHMAVRERARAIGKHFDEAIHYIRQAIESGGRVLVHCRHGINRSASVVIAYLMETESLTYKESFIKLQYEKPNIMPSRSFKEFLQNRESLIFRG